MTTCVKCSRADARKTVQRWGRVQRAPSSGDVLAWDSEKREAVRAWVIEAREGYVWQIKVLSLLGAFVGALGVAGVGRGSTSGGVVLIVVGLAFLGLSGLLPAEMGRLAVWRDVLDRAADRGTRGGPRRWSMLGRGRRGARATARGPGDLGRLT